MAAGEKDDDCRLSLSLSLRCPEITQSPATSPFHLSSFDIINNNNNNHHQILRSFFDTENVGKRYNLDVNILPAPENEAVDGGDGEARKKLRLSKEQAAVLEETFKDLITPTMKQKMGLAKQLNLRPRQVEVWFQNRRARTKLKQSGEDFDHLMSYRDVLKEENKQLQKELKELRGMKMKTCQLYPQMNHLASSTTLIMCPSCERVTVLSSSKLGTLTRGDSSSFIRS